MRRSRPTFAGSDAASDAAPHGTRQASRPLRLVEREAPYMLSELKRIAMVTGTCVALLAALTVVDRMR